MKSICFIGHRKVENAAAVRQKLQQILPELIRNGAERFLLGDHSEFNSICYDVISELKKVYPQIMRIHFRTDYQYADEYTLRFLLQGYEETVFPPQLANVGKAVYIKRNRAMIDQSDICIFYYNEKYLPPRRKQSAACVIEYQPNSGTAAAYTYAAKQQKQCINLCENK